MISSARDMLRNAMAGRIATMALVAIVALSVIGPSPIGHVAGSRRKTTEIASAMHPAITEPALTAIPEIASSEASLPRATPTASQPSATPAAADDLDSTIACAADGTTEMSTTPDDLVEGRALVTVSALNLRVGPGTDCPVVGSLGFGMEVQLAPEIVKADDHLWRKVSSPVGDGYTVAHAYQNLPSVAPADVPVLMYHHIGDGPDRYFVPEAVFEQQVSWLKEHGYVSITPRDLYNARYKGLELPARPVMFTIDDGNESTWPFKEILDKYGFRGVYFLPDYAEQSDEEIRELDSSGEVCGHTVDHPDLATLGYDAQYAEIVNNKAWLEDILGHPVTCFGYPFGSYNDVTNQVMAASGYTTAFNAWGGAAAVSGDADPFHILRDGVYADYSWDTFLSIVHAEDGAPS